MKRKTLMLLFVIVSLCLYVAGCSEKSSEADMGNPDALPPVKTEETMEERLEESWRENWEECWKEKATPTDEEIAKSLKIAIEDEMWFHNKGSYYASLVNEEMEYEYFFDETKDAIDILSTTPSPKKGIYNYEGNYYLLGLALYDGHPTNKITSVSFHKDYQKIRAKLPLEPTGKGKIEIGERRKPEYDIDEADMQEATENILLGFYKNMEDDCWDLYIRYFYKVSYETIVLYKTPEGIQYGTSVDLKSGIPNKPFRLQKDQAALLLMCSYKVEES